MAVKLKPNKNGLVPVIINVSEAGLGLRKGEIRGVSLAVAERMIARGSAKPVTADNKEQADKEALEELVTSEKELGA